MITSVSSTRRAPIDRSADRHVAVVAIAVSIAFLGAALASLVVPAEVRRGLWLPLHLALAGGASTAIAGLLPFFIAAFAAAPPTRPVIRGASVACVAFGASLVAIGVTATMAVIAAAGGILFITGICLVTVSGLAPLRSGLGPRGGIVTQGYIVALAMVGAGALLATLFVAGWPPVIEAWSRLRPAHAWLNLVGFVSLVIATTLIHFFPTVVGSRIVAHRSARTTVVALALGPLLAATGYALQVGLLVRAGAGVALIGAIALGIYAFRIWVKRARWTTDHAWHRFAIGGLASSIAWLIIGMAVLAGRAMIDDTPSGWAVTPVVGPLVAGWVGLAVIASATHLLPAVGPGNHVAHARQRKLLGRGVQARLVVANLGVAGLSLGMLTGWSDIALFAAVLIAALFLSTAALIVGAIALGVRPGRP